ncbi:site-specific integrase [Myceligenerans halotolerans]
MSIVKHGKRWRAKLKNGRIDVDSQVFDTKTEAQEWLRREQAALRGGVDPRAGKEPVKSALERWIVTRKTTVASTTYESDKNMIRLMPTSMKNVRLSAVSDREVARAFEKLLASGLKESSVKRFRASLSPFFSWCVREKLIRANPVTGVKVPKGSEEVEEMDPFEEGELEAAYLAWKAKDERLANILLVMAWTGLRWGEARVMQVADFVEVPTPGLMVRRSQSEGHPLKATKSRRSRRVPLANRVLLIVRDLAEGKGPYDLLFTPAGGGQLWRAHTLRMLSWSKKDDAGIDIGTGRGRRLHDLRHTAACLWLTRGVEPGTVQAWCGHESIATTNRYLHFLGTSADRAGLNRLNDDPGGTRGARDTGTDD